MCKMGTSAAGEVVTMPALGRPFSVGMLYDCRSDQLLSGMTLWEDDILKYKKEQKHMSSNYKVLCSDSLQEKAKAFDMSGSLRLSFLCGLVNLDGSGKYLDVKRESSQHQWVALRYRCTTRVESLTMTQLGEGRVQHPKVFNIDKATHVVTSVTYGATAVFDFYAGKKDSSTEFEASGQGGLGVEGSKSAKGFLANVVKRIPGTKVDGGGQCKWTESEEEKIKMFVCKFYGDFMLPENPSSYEDAVRVYKTLPKLLGEKGENAVPVEVQLYPLCQIDDKASKLVRNISTHLLNRTEKFFEEIDGYDGKCNDLLEFDAVNRFSAIGLHIKDFKDLIDDYRAIIQKDLCELLPLVKGGNEDCERKIAELFKEKSMSPFSKESLRSWLQANEKDIKVLSGFTRALSDVKFATEPSDLEPVIKDLHNRHCLCLIFSLPSHASQIEAMQEYCLGTNTARVSTQSVAEEVSSTPSTQELVCIFRDFYNANKANNNEVSFIVAQEFSECSSLNARIEYYKNGERKSSNYELPSAPERVKVLVEGATHDSLAVEWEPPQYGASAITSYVVSCNQEAAEEMTSCLTVSHENNRVTMTGLATNAEYKVQVRGTLEVGQSPFREAEAVAKTRPASPPEVLHIQKASPTEVLLVWRAPEFQAAECSVEHYVIKHETGSGRWEEKICTNLNDLAYKVEVKPSGVHKFKVSAFCGSVGYTCDSKSVTVDFAHLDTSEDLKQYICANSSVVPDSPHIFVPKMRVISDDSKHRRVEVGDIQGSVAKKVVLLVGEHGSGVNALIDAIVNYIFGVKWEDSFRFRVTCNPADSQAEAQTNRITSYTVHHHEGSLVPYSITLIQTPGLGSNRLENQEILKNVDSFFATADITHIDAVGLAVSASGTTLTPWQTFVLDEALSLFGKDIADNMFLLFPFSDGSEPRILGALQKRKLSFRKHFSLNTSALYARWSADCRRTGSGSDEDYLKMASLLWDMGVQSLRLFLEEVTFVERKSLSLTRKVLSKWIALEKELRPLNTSFRGVISRVASAEDTLQTLQVIALKPNPVSIVRIFYRLRSSPLFVPNSLEYTLQLVPFLGTATSATREVAMLTVKSKISKCLTILEEENLDEEMIHFLMGCGRQEL